MTLRFPHPTTFAATPKKHALHLHYIYKNLLALLYLMAEQHMTIRNMIVGMEEVGPEHPPKKPSIKPDSFFHNQGLI